MKVFKVRVSIRFIGRCASVISMQRQERKLAIFRKSGRTRRRNPIIMSTGNQSITAPIFPQVRSIHTQKWGPAAPRRPAEARRRHHRCVSGRLANPELAEEISRGRRRSCQKSQKVRERERESDCVVASQLYSYRYFTLVRVNRNRTS